MLALILFVERPLRHAALAEKDPRFFPGLSPAAVSRIRLRWRNQRETLLVRSNGQWSLAAPLRYPADTNQVERFLSGLAALEWQTRLTASDLNERTNALEDFGLSSPQVSLAIEAGGVERSLLVGSVTALGDQVFVQIVGGDGCYLAGAAFLKSLPPDANDWRDRRLVDWTAGPGDRIKVVSPPGMFELERNASNRIWSLVWPLPARADSPKVETLLAGLGALRVARFVSDVPAPDYDAFGLRSPSLQILLGRGTNYESGLWVGGSPSNSPGLVYVRRPESPAVFLLEATNLAPWRVSLTEFRDRHIVSLASNETALMEIQGGDPTRVARDKNGIWKVISPSQFEADPGLINGIFSVLEGSEVNFEKAVVTDFAAYGLTSPPLSVVLWRNPDARAESMIARVDFGAVQGGRVYVRRSDETAVNSISLKDYETLPRRSWQLHDRRIWSFAPSAVFSVTISQKGEKLRLVHGGPRDLSLPRSTNDWSVAPGYEGVLNPYSMEEAALRLGSLQAVAWAGRGEDAADRFGVKGTDHEVILSVKEGSTMRDLSVQFGGRAPDQNPYAAVLLDGERWFFEFPLALYREFVVTDLSIHAPPESPGR